MNQITVKVAATLDAPAAAVYATIADYRHGHPNILPKQNLYGLRVEEGGYGAGTVIRFKSRVLGVERAFYQRVSEPVPGIVLVEQDIEEPKQEATTFTVNPVEQGRKADVAISTTMTLSSGLNGMIERMVIPWVLRSIYRQELALLESVARQRAATPAEESLAAQ